MYGYIKSSNTLLKKIFLFSFLVHLVVFIGFLNVYKGKNLNYIELTIKDFAENLKRKIPRPKIIKKRDNLPKEIKKKIVKPFFYPEEQNFTADRFDNNLNEIDSKDFVPISGETIESNSGSFLDKDGIYTNKKDYYDIIKLKIEANKVYPKLAKDNFIEGQVTLYFILLKDGNIRNLKIVKSSNNSLLDEEALNAIKNSVPFPALPDKFFKKSTEITISIMFELN